MGFSFAFIRSLQLSSEDLTYSARRGRTKGKGTYQWSLSPFMELLRKHHPEASASSQKCVMCPPAQVGSTNCAHYHPEQNRGSVRDEEAETGWWVGTGGKMQGMLGG